ncbi:glycerophosphodiester phosphodiesterase family protein [Streptomyces sp. NBC_00341]|uniref:glycerophosphodiester phosphodiesterase n=1 Tax=unclassified Streptomyces TaxID=2593676 RepID=UPI0009404853|nr:glycerophosphodiester phosphodiesterase family protein [Streptomyces sp. CB02488]OKK20062.1 glycerophosphodiester phosphodiesterase [Streptomyces sp. CB02488]WRZ10868.1 glycerophosphodiester phosphodiesterase family protein [Streptomyces sp. NBC_00341]
MHAGTATATASVAAAALLAAGTFLLSNTDVPVPDTSTAAAGPAVPVTRATAAPSGAPLVIAHRGASAYAPENTLAAVDRAHALGFDWVENDIQFTKDGVLVVIHDTDLKRTTDAEEVFPDRAPWAVKDFTAAEIARLDAGSWFGVRYAGTRVPTLRQYLERIEHNHQSLLMEIKSPETYPGIERAALQVLDQEGWLDAGHVRDRLVIQSFGADSVRTVHKQRPDVITGFLGTPAVAELPAYAEFTDRINPTYTSVSGEYVAAVHALKGPHHKKLQVDTWTVNDAAHALRVTGYGVDGIITNAPDVVRAATGARVTAGGA